MTAGCISVMMGQPETEPGCPFVPAIHSHSPRDPKEKEKEKCPASPDGKHQWVLTGREIEVRRILFLEIHNRMDNWKCTACGAAARTGA